MRFLRRFPHVLVDVGVVDIASVAVFLQDLRRVERGVSASHRIAYEIAGLLRQHVCGIALLPVVDVAQYDDGR
ncbi:hypothetical protein SAMN05216414_11646 [Nitrosovibrio sp. Nv17]|nr:hypothetical protein SAMN05216414_11646 [Nitrosovibrio sp. Nv17]